MSNNKKLKYLSINDFSKLKNYDGLEKAPALEGLDFGNAVWARTELVFFPDMGNTNLKVILHNAKLPLEGVYNMLKAPSLEELNFNSGTYPTEFLAWICANYPQLKGECLKPYIEYEDGYITVCGKRKRTFDATTEKGMKMRKNAVVKFKKMMEEYKDMSFEEIYGIVNRGE